MGEIVLEGGLPARQRKKIAEALFDLANADVPLVFELLIVSEEEIKELNARERNIDKVTDVLSFPTMEDVKNKPILSEEHGECLDEEGRLLAGSIVLCKKRAEEQAKEYGHSLAREMSYLIVHGVLHCLGYDHEDEEEKREMREKEEQVMKKLKLERNV